jgi:DNA-binding NtrC family response regulator
LDSLGDFKTCTAGSIIQAVTAIKKRRFDIIVSEFKFNEGNVLDLLALIKNQGQNIPLIVFSFENEKALEAVKLGANSFVSKEGNVEDVFIKLRDKIKQIV